MNYGFLHASDIHLNMKFDNREFSLREREKRRGELWDAFDKIIEIAKDGIRYLFISGDLTQQEYCSFNDIRRIAKGFASVRDTRIIIVCGENDAWGINNMYGYIDWPDNVYIVKSTSELEKIYFNDDGVCIYAVSAGEQPEDDSIQPVCDIQTDDNMINVLVAYGLKESEIGEVSGRFDYCALGGEHNYRCVSDNAVYSGTPEPICFSESGEHGAVRGILSKEGTTHEFVVLCKRKFIVRDIELDISYDFNKILDLIKFSGDTFSNIKDYVRINLTGTVNSDISMEEIKNEAGQFFYYIEFGEDYTYKNNTERIYEGSEYTIIESYKLQFDKLNANDRLQQQAFELGLDALRKEKVVS